MMHPGWGSEMERVDDKGKIFTERVRTHCVEVNVITIQGSVHGFVHVEPGLRVKDQLNNRDEQFLAVTFATIFQNEHDPNVDADPQHVTFVALNKNHIISVIPVNEKRSEDDD